MTQSTNGRWKFLRQSNLQGAQSSPPLVSQGGLSAEQEGQIIADAAREVSQLSREERENQDALWNRARRAVMQAARRQGIDVLPEPVLRRLTQRTLDQAGGFGFLADYMPPRAPDVTDVMFDAQGRLWVRRKGQRFFERVPLEVTVQEAWRVVNALLAPLGRSCTEARPTVIARLPRDPERGFSGARVKVIHPSVAPGGKYPTIALRFYEIYPVTPEQVIQWDMVSEPVMQALVDMVAAGTRIMITGGTGVGKTTFLSALCRGIPAHWHIVKAEDPMELALDHPHVTSLEARPVTTGGDVAPYTLADAIKDAMRLNPDVVIVGEVLDGESANTLASAMMTGHQGLTTFHAVSPRHALRRMAIEMSRAEEGMSLDVAVSTVAEAVDVIVQLAWDREHVRRVMGIYALTSELTRSGRIHVDVRPLWERPEAKAWLDQLEDRVAALSRIMREAGVEVIA